MRWTTAVTWFAAGVLLLGGCIGGNESDATVDAGTAMAMEAADRGEPVAELGHLAIHGPYVPASPTDMAVLYFVVVNEGREADRLIGIGSAAARITTLHQTVIDGESSRMSMVKGGLEIPPGGEVVLAPGGYHAMLMDLVEPLKVGDLVHATLEFESAGTMMIEAPVTDGAGGGMANMAGDGDEGS